MASERLARDTATTALAAISLIALAGLIAGAVRVLPWLLDPGVPWNVAQPFARGLAAVALEAALVVGWPVGWALASFRFLEAGEARVLQTLGEAPHRTVLRLAPRGALFAAGLGAVALAYGRDAVAPGRVATELLEQGRASCAWAMSPSTHPVPFTELTWLCAPDRNPRLVGPVPGNLGGVVATAADARIAGDFRKVELDDARVLLPGKEELPVAVHATTLVVRGMAPWARASAFPPAVRAAVLVSAGWIASLAGVFGVLAGAARTRLGALAIGAVGPIGALATMRLLERSAGAPGSPGLLAFASVPLVAGGVTLSLAAALSRLRLTGHAATNWFKV